MVLVKEFSSEKEEIIDSKDFELYDITAEKFEKEEIEKIIDDLNNKLNLIIYPSYGNIKWKASIIFSINKEEIKIIKVIVLLPNNEISTFVMESLTGYKFPIECNIYEEEPKEKTTKFKETGKLWCNTIQNYLENEFGFKGLTKLKIFGHAGYLEIFNISISGKGTNDFLVETMGFISDMVSTSKIHYYSDYNKIYNIVNSYFKS